jgi:hypothetical protein
MILWDTWYVDYKKKVKIKFLLVEKYSSTVDLMARISKDLHTAIHCKYQIAKRVSNLSYAINQESGLGMRHSFFFL